MSENRLENIEAKLTALLAISVDQYLRETGVATPRPRSIDTLLRDAGLDAGHIAGILGKSKRAVYLMWKKDDES